MRLPRCLLGEMPDAARRLNCARFARGGPKRPPFFCPRFAVAFWRRNAAGVNSFTPVTRKIRRAICMQSRINCTPNSENRNEIRFRKWKSDLGLPRCNPASWIFGDFTKMNRNGEWKNQIVHLGITKHGRRGFLTGDNALVFLLDESKFDLFSTNETIARRFCVLMVWQYNPAQNFGFVPPPMIDERAKFLAAFNKLSARWHPAAVQKRK